MRTSEKGREFIKGFESLALEAYRDGGGVWTIGWGHTGPEVREGLVWTLEQAEHMFEVDLAYFEGGVSMLVKVPLQQYEFDALVSFAYNVGLDIDQDTKAEGLGDSTLLRKLNAGDRAGAAAEFPKWRFDNGKEVRGLLRRRMSEKAMFLNGEHHG